MSGTRKLRQKILASFLAVMMIVAIGAEIRSFDQSGHNNNGASDVDIGLAMASKPISRKNSFFDQLALINNADLVASRFYAPMHAPIIWTR